MIIYVTAVIIAMDILGVNVMPFVAGAGVAGIAIGFAAKDTLSNLIAGVLLLVDRPFGLHGHDIRQLGDGLSEQI